MKLKRLYLLIIFIFSFVVSQLHITNYKPPLLEYKDSNNIVLLIDSRDFHSNEIVSATLPNNNPIIISDGVSWKGLPFFITTAVFILCSYVIVKKNTSIDRFQFTGIVFRYPHRVLLN